MAATRRLAAIMFTDMVGSTASAQADEAGALKLRDEQAGLVRPLFAAHQGREIKSMGDGFLAEFDSALRAVQCAIDIQQHLHERNSQTGVTPILLRIGIHLGDVEQRETDIFGDAVNIASRIEPLSLPGGVCFSGEVFSQIRNKIPNKLEKLPPAPLKGLQVSMDVYQVVLPWTGQGTPPEHSGPTGIAVLPFTNISPDPKDEYFADGLTEELISVLSQLRELRVIARTSVTPYKATSKGIAQIGAELGVSSILEGSVRKAGNQLRITAQLIDVVTQGHLWANSYNRELNDVFAVQAELATQVAEALKIELRATEKAQLGARPAVKSEAYLAYIKGRTLLHQGSDVARQAAKAQFELALSLDPKYAAAYSGLADATRLHGQWAPYYIPRAEWEEPARRLIATALELDPNLAEAHASLASTLWSDFDLPGAETEYQRALSLNPSYSLAHRWYAEFLEDEGRADEALVEFRLAEAADPLSPLNLMHFARLLVWLGKFDEAFSKIQKLAEIEPDGDLYHGGLRDYSLARSDIAQGLKEIRWFEDRRTDPRDKQRTRAFYYAVSGEKEKARALLRQDEALPDRPQSAQYTAWLYADLGDLDDCFRWLDKAIAAGRIDFAPWRLDPSLAHVRSDPRFQAVLKKLKLA